MRAGLAVAVLGTCWAVSLAASPAHAGDGLRDVSLRWRAGGETPVNGYVIVVGPAPGWYEQAFPVGLSNPVDGIHTADITLDAYADQYVAVLAFNEHGLSPPSNERSFVALARPDSGEGTLIALGAANPGERTPMVDAAGLIYDAPGSTAPRAGQHVAWCELDGDGVPDRVLGQDGSGGGKAVAILASGVTATLPSPSASARPACGDLDGDGLDEIVIGLDGSLLLRIFDDAQTGFALLSSVGPLGTRGGLPRGTWAGGAPGDGPALPAVGDVDGDGLDEIVIGLESGGGRFLRVLDDVVAELAPLSVGPIQDGWLDASVEGGALWPALGDVDRDGRDELAYGFGSPAAGSFVRVLDDPVEAPQVPITSGWIPLLPAGPDAGPAHPSFGDLDGDGAADLVVGFGAAFGDAVLVLTDVLDDPMPLGPDDGWLDVSRHALEGPIHPAVRGPTHVIEPPAVWLGGGPLGSELVGVRVDGSVETVAAGSLASPLPTRLAQCHASGSAVTELLTGRGPGGLGRARLAIVIEGTAWLAGEISVGPADYGAANGELRPACGDFDGDGLDELVFGPGPGGNGVVWIRDDPRSGYRPWPGLDDGELRWTTWGAYLMFGGGSRPAAGDIDGDGRDELVIGLGEGGHGWLQIRDDASTGFAPMQGPGLVAGWLQWTPDDAYAIASGAASPALGDLDGDGRDELVVGVDANGSGQLVILDDAIAGFTPLVDPEASHGIRLDGVGDGSTHPALADVDADGRDEIVVGFGAGGEDRVYVVDDALAGFGPHPSTPGGRGFLALPPGLSPPVMPAAGAR